VHSALPVDLDRSYRWKKRSIVASEGGGIFMAIVKKDEPGGPAPELASQR
jgi:hypothetical protein